MKKQSLRINLIMVSLFLMVSGLYAQNKDWANLQRYDAQNKEIKASGMKVKAVFIGNSITEGWANADPAFFKDNNYVGRGIGGQTTPQMLLRFRADVLDLKPDFVVINGGINDIAENTGKYDFDFTVSNLKSMAELAHDNGIKVIMTSVLPAAYLPWRQNIENVPEQVMKLNDAIKAYAKAKKFIYVDYYSEMVNAEKGMIKEYTTDEVHVTGDGYKVMEAIVKKAIDKKKK